MNRYRFYIPGDDGRPMTFPPDGPFWVTGYSDTHTVVVAYSRDRETLATYWPDAENVVEEENSPVSFPGRFPKPDWWPE